MKFVERKYAVTAALLTYAAGVMAWSSVALIGVLLLIVAYIILFSRYWVG